MCNLLTAEIQAILGPSQPGKTLFITVGNTLRSDDGVGPYLAEGLASWKGNGSLLNAGDAPESIVAPALALAPDKVVILDAADFGGEPGELRMIPRECIPEHTLTTHTFPLAIIAKLIEQDTGAKVYFLGIQPVKVAWGESLSAEVKRTADEIIQFILKRAPGA